MKKFLSLCLLLTVSLPVLAEPDFATRTKFKGVTLENPNFHIWGSSPIWDDQGTLHLFTARWPSKVPFHPGWTTHSEIAHYTSKSPAGPWTDHGAIFKGDGVKGSWKRFAPHNPCIKLIDGKYVLTFIGNDGPKGDKDASSRFPSNQRIGMAIADSPNGPWKLVGDKDGLILERPTTQPELWCNKSRCGVNNPALIKVGDKYHLYFKAMSEKQGPRRYGVAIADKITGPYTIQPKPLTSNKGMIEDASVFAENNQIHLLTTDMHGPIAKLGGILWSSKDGVNFNPKPQAAYWSLKKYLTPEQQKSATHVWSNWSIQRPQVLLDPKTGKPTHFFTPAGTNPKGTKNSILYYFKINPPTE